MMFGKLHDDIFRPLAGKNRELFASCLVRLRDTFFGSGGAESLPSPTEVRCEIAATLAELNVDPHKKISTDDWDLGEKGETVAAYIYRRLVACGWLEEEKDEEFRSLACMAPAAALCLNFLVGIKDNMALSYGGTISTLFSIVRAAVEDPTNHGLALREAERIARDFASHTMAIVHGIKEIEKEMLRSTRPQELLDTFFERFVAGIMITDYKKLYSDNSPYRFRHQCLEVLGRILTDERLALAIATAQADDGTPDVGEVRRQACHIMEQLRNVDHRLALIERNKARLEGRVVQTVRLLGSGRAGLSQRLTDLLARLGRQPAAPVPALATSHLVRIFDERAPHAYRKRARIAAATIVEDNNVSAEYRNYKRALDLWRAEGAPSEADVIAYAEASLAGETRKKFSELPCRTRPELSCLMTLANPRMLSTKGRKFFTRYRILKTGRGMTGNDYIILDDFVLERKRA